MVCDFDAPSSLPVGDLEEHHTSVRVGKGPEQQGGRGSEHRNEDFRFLTKISRPIPSASFALNPHGFNRELFFRSRQGAGLP